MNIEVRQNGGVSILTPIGDFWSGGGWELYDKVKEVVDHKRIHIIIDLSNIQRVNSQGIGVMVSCLKSVRDSGGDIRFVGVNDHVLNVLKIVNLYTLLHIHATEDEALMQFNAG